MTDCKISKARIWKQIGYLRCQGCGLRVNDCQSRSHQSGLKNVIMSGSLSGAVMLTQENNLRFGTCYNEHNLVQAMCNKELGDHISEREQCDFSNQIGSCKIGISLHFCTEQATMFLELIRHK